MAQMMPMMAAMLKPMADQTENIAKDVEAGKYNSIEEVKQAMQALNPMGGMAPPGGVPRGRRTPGAGTGEP
jgi:hypothetical protein